MTMNSPATTGYQSYQQERNTTEIDVDVEELAVLYRERQSKWLPHSLELLFSGRKDINDEEQVQRISRRQQVYTEEAQLMELLADKAADEDPTLDDGELEGSGDNFEG
ncbi:hypothetical protein BDQ17DRAFT_1494820 [Cyathus striatus]|nr:hypothetical protein BDQ17DRAFT_1494820 [Cyathus striatus]